MQSFRARYEELLADRGWQPDDAQLQAVAEFDALEQRLRAAEAAPSLGGRLLSLLSGGRADTPLGLYLYGGVGRGKTLLVDLFCERAVVPVRRLHFNHFMQQTHAALFALPDEADPLSRVARSWAEQCRVLCLDELVVGDIADAMILGRLFGALTDSGVVLVFTSNTPPSGLYEGGLQRARFLPAIELLNRQTRVALLDAGIDYRLRELAREPLWIVGPGPAADAQLARRFALLAGDAGSTEVTLTVVDRPIVARRQTATGAWFDFTALCEGPRSVADYIAIAERYTLVALSGIPVFHSEDDDAARRFIALIDEIYDRGVKLLATAAAAPQDTYQGTRLEFPFRRTASRLIEMQSREYLGRGHRAVG